MTFLENKKLLTDCQYRFRNKRSTTLATILFCDTIRKEISHGKLVGFVYIDLSKAFRYHQPFNVNRVTNCYDKLLWFVRYLARRSQIISNLLRGSSRHKLRALVAFLCSTIIFPTIFNIAMLSHLLKIRYILSLTKTLAS